MTNKAHSAKGVPFEVLMNKCVRENLLVAAEACFEMDPTPSHEAWIEKLSTEQRCNIWCNTKLKNALGATLVQHKKHHKTQQNITKQK